MLVSDLLGKFQNVTRQPDGWLAHCPAHSDAQASLRIAVTPDGTGLLTCRAGCKIESVLAPVGVAFSELFNMTGIDADDAISAQRQESLPIEEIAALRVRLDGYNAASFPEVHAYALRRFGVDEETFDRLGLGSSDDLPDGARLVVPFCNPVGVALGFQARALDSNARVRWYGPSNPQVGSWSRIGFFQGGSGYQEVIVTEGPGDALAAAAAGFDSIGVRGAGLAGDDLAKQIFDWTGERPVVIAGDGDRAGRTFSATLADALSNLGVLVRVLSLDEGLDLSDWFGRNPGLFATDLMAAVAVAPRASTTASALLQRDENLYPLNDLGNARFVAALAEQQGTAIRYVEEIGFLTLLGGIWQEDRLDRARSIVHSACDLVKNIADTLTESAGSDRVLQINAKKWQSHAKHCASSSGITAVLNEIKALPGVATRIEDLDRHIDLLAVRNGVVNLRTGELMPHDPLLLLTKRVEVDFKPDATAPRWERFLDEVMCSDKSMTAYLKRLVGYSISGSTHEQCFSVFWGSGSNGKSVFTTTISSIFDSISESTPFSTFEEKPSGGIPNDIAALRAARIVFATEGGQAPMAEALLKRVTGRDPVTARFLRKEYFTFVPMFQIMLSTNSKPNFTGQDEGLWRRVKLVEWARFFAPDERDTNLFTDLLAEREGILAWAVAGAKEWYVDGLNDPEPIISATKNYRDTSDVLAGFLPGVFTYDTSAKRVLGRDIFDQYLLWAAEENLKTSEIYTRRKFFSVLEERGVVKNHVNEGVAFSNIRRTRPSDLAETVASVDRLDAPRPLTTSGKTSEVFGL